jgi:hypothetical protein
MYEELVTWLARHDDDVQISVNNALRLIRQHAKK